jgi:hypothetical protein
MAVTLIVPCWVCSAALSAVRPPAVLCAQPALPPLLSAPSPLCSYALRRCALCSDALRRCALCSDALCLCSLFCCSLFFDEVSR